MFTEGLRSRHLTWRSRRKRDNEGDDSEVSNKLSTCGVAVGPRVAESNYRARLSHVATPWTSRDFCFSWFPRSRTHQLERGDFFHGRVFS